MPGEAAECRAVAIVVAGGTGVRFGGASGKQMAEVLGEPLLAHTVRALGGASTIDRIVLVCHPDRVQEYHDAVVASARPETPIEAVAGGSTRQESVAAGLSRVGADNLIVAVHDGARPLIESKTVDDAVRALYARTDLSGVVVGHRMYDTLKVVDGDIVAGTPDRSKYWVAQTPQVFWVEALRSAYAAAASEGRTGTDDASLVEAGGGRVGMLEGPRDNIKVTVEEDVPIVEAILKTRGEAG